MKVFTFCPVSVVIAKPLGTRPAVLCFFTSLTETTGIATYRDRERHKNNVRERMGEANVRDNNISATDTEMHSG